MAWAQPAPRGRRLHGRLLGAGLQPATGLGASRRRLGRLSPSPGAGRLLGRYGPRHFDVRSRQRRAVRPDEGHQLHDRWPTCRVDRDRGRLRHDARHERDSGRQRPAWDADLVLRSEAPTERCLATRRRGFRSLTWISWAVRFAILAGALVAARSPMITPSTQGRHYSVSGRRRMGWLNPIANPSR